jgi:hypothetical protein
MKNSGEKKLTPKEQAIKDMKEQDIRTGVLKRKKEIFQSPRLTMRVGLLGL